MNKRLLTLAAAAVLALALNGCSRSPEARRDKYMSAGKEFLQKHDYPRAILQFRNAAEAMPRDADVYYQLGLAYTALQDYTTAVANFQRVLSLSPNRSDAELAVAQIFARTANVDLLQDAEKRLNKLIESGFTKPDTLTSLALTEFRLGHRDNAIQALEQALARSPGAFTASLMLARAKLEDRNPAAAETVLKKAVAEAPQSAEAHRFLGGFYFAQGKLAEADTELRKSVALDSKNTMALIDLADLHLARRMNQEAEALYKEVSKRDGYRQIYGVFLMQEGRQGEAIQEFERAAKAFPDDRQARTQLVAAYRSANRPGDAHRILEDALKKNPKDYDALLQQSEIFVLEGNQAAAEAALNQVLQTHPESPEVHYVRAKVHEARGEGLSYRRELTESLRLNPRLLPVRLELVQSLTAAKATTDALNILNAAPADQQQATGVSVQRNWIYWSAKNYSEMRKGVDAGLARERSAELLLQDGVLKLQTGNAPAAQAAFEQALKIDPTDLRAVAALARSFAARNQPGVALKQVREFAAAHPKSGPAQQLLAMLLLASGDHAQARAALNTAVSLNPRLTSPQLDLVRLDAIESKWDDAASRLKQILANDPRNSTAIHWLGDVAITKGDMGGALEYFQKAIDADPRSARALNNIAYLLMEHRKNPDEALKYAQKAAELAPDDPNVADTLGWVLYQKGLYGRAVEYLKRGATQQNAICKYHLEMAYAKAGHAADAQSTLETALKMNPNLPEAQVAIAVVKPGR